MNEFKVNDRVCCIGVCDDNDRVLNMFGTVIELINGGELLKVRFDEENVGHGAQARNWNFIEPENYLIHI